MVGKPAAAPKAPEPYFAVGIDERAPRRIGNQDGTWPHGCNWFWPFILRNSRVKW